MLNLRLYLEVEGRERSLEVALDEDHPGQALYDAIAPKIGRDAAGFGLHLKRLEEPVHPQVTLSAYLLRSGDRLDVVDRHPAGPPIRGAEWGLRVVDGPGQGLEIPVPRGTLALGREMGDIDLADTSISRRHAILRTSEGDLTIEDAASTNGTEVNGATIRTVAKLSPGDRIGIGESVLEVFRPKSVALPTHITYDQGALPVNRPPRVVTAPPARVFQIPAPPETPPKRRLPLAASLIPVVLGIAMYFAMRAMNYGSPLYLLFVAGGPVMALASWIGDRRSGRADFSKKKAQYEQSLRSIGAEAEEAQKTGMAWRHQRYPAPDATLEWAPVLSPTLWHRRPTDPDFLDLRLGIATQPSLVSFRVAVGGDEALAKKGAELTERFALDPGVPFSLSLREAAVVGIVSDRLRVPGLGRWLTLQLATHHSPRDVALAIVAPSAGPQWEWTKWLPHTEGARPGQTRIATTDGAAQTLLDELRTLAAERSAAGETLIASTSSSFLPHVVLVIQPPLHLPAREVIGLLEAAGNIGMSVLWFAEERIALPPPVRVVVEDLQEEAVVTYAAGGKQVVGVTLDRVHLDRAQETALALAPLVDATKETAAAAIPDRLDLVDLIDPQPLTAAEVIERWSHAPPSLRTLIGAGAGKPAAIDMVKDGPHGLVAGTTGSGKSELLQTLVASLAVTFPPSRVNFVLIDYKGGAAFKDCVRLPHTVGFVTDLDERLAERAIASLNAELRWRERLLGKGGYKDLAEMRQRAPGDTPPNLLLIVDEFAALKAEVPAFVDGVIDIAQRGRSLGVHLLLATQKPAGVISANVQANTNLRIALRVTDPQESIDVIGRPDAAHLSRHLPGRAFVKTGSAELNEVQVAYVGGAGRQEMEAEPARTFRISPSVAAAAFAHASATGPSHLTRMVQAASDAAGAIRSPEQRRPWLPPLNDTIGLLKLADGGSAEAHAPDAILGVADDTTHQAQPSFTLDLDHCGSAIIYGAAGTGKTTALRTLAASIARTHPPAQVHLYGLDFAGRGLASITHLPHCGDVVYGDDTERVRRFIAMLGAAADERRRRLGQVGASSAAEYRRLQDEPMPAIVTLIDGFGALWDALEPLDRGVHFDALLRLIGEGRSAGLHFVITADRRGAIPSALSSTIPRRVMLRLASADEYSGAGMRPPAGYEKAPAGRAWIEGREIQIAVVDQDGDASGTGQARALSALGEQLTADDADGLPDPVRMLPDEVFSDELPEPAPGARSIPIGLEETRLDPAMVDLARSPGFLVVGPSGSGRTTALRTLVAGLRAAWPDLETYLLGVRRSALYEENWWKATARGASQVETLAERLLARLPEREAATPGIPLLLVIDDGDTLTEGKPATALDAIVGRAGDAGVIVVAALTTYRALRCFTGWPQALRQQRSGLILQPEEDTDADVFQVRLPRRAGLVAPPGRGYLVQGNAVSLIQLAT